MKKKNHIKMRFSTLLLCCLTILLCTAAYGTHSPVYTVEVGDVLNVGTGKNVERIENDYLMVKGGTVNLYPGAYVDDGIYAFDGSTVNIYAGELGAGSFITLLGINSTASTAVVTIYGTEFKVDDYPCDYGKVTLTGGSGTLTGEYDYYGDTSEINLWILSDTPINLQPPLSDGPKEITIDIKPGGNPNNINLKSRGVVPVAILTTDVFDAGDVDPETVEFAGTKPVRSMLCDVDDDGNDDLLFHFKTQELFENDLNEDSTDATLTGEVYNGDVISGTDKVWIVPRRKEK